MLFLVNLRPLPKIPAWGGVVNAIFSKFTTPPQNQSLGRDRNWYNYPCHVSPITCTSNLRPLPTSTVLYNSVIRALITMKTFVNITLLAVSMHKEFQDK